MRRKIGMSNRSQLKLPMSTLKFTSRVNSPARFLRIIDFLRFLLVGSEMRSSKLLISAESDPKTRLPMALFLSSPTNSSFPA